MGPTAGQCVCLCLLLCAAASGSCPTACICRGSHQSDAGAPPGGMRVTCRGEQTPVKKIAHLDLGNLPENTTVLDLSGNLIRAIPRRALDVSSLEKLDLNDNQISRIEANAFEKLPELLRLNLTGNQLVVLTKEMFNGLDKLERLSLSNNRIKTLSNGVFDSLPALKKLDFRSVVLLCDCHLRWVVSWMRVTGVRVSRSTECALPRELHGVVLSTAHQGALHCDWPVKLTHFVVTPTTAQVVFEGDRLPLTCTASLLDPATRVRWLYAGEAVLANQTAAVSVRSTAGHGLVKAEVLLGRLSVGQSGQWRCEARTALGVASLSVTVSVVPATAATCPRDAATTTRGHFIWPRTLSGLTVTLACEGGAARRRCGDGGEWGATDDGRCQFRSKLTQALQQYSKSELSNITMLLSRISQRQHFIPDATTVTDKMDVIFTARIVEKLSKLVEGDEKLSDVILHLVSVMMDVNETLLQEAQQEERSCSKLVRAVEALPAQLLLTRSEVSRHVRGVAVTAIRVTPRHFAGLTCVVRDVHDAGFVCRNHTDDGGDGDDASTSQQAVGASVRLSADLLASVRCLYPVCTPPNTFTLQVVAFRNARLFPQHGGATSRQTVATSVISTRIVGVAVEKTTSDVVIHLLSRVAGVNRRAVRWLDSANEGRGRWLTSGCSLANQVGELSVIHCSQLTSVAVMQMQPAAPSELQKWLLEYFNLGAAIYVGTAVLVVCLLVTIVSLIVCRRSLLMPVKTRHALANTCVSLLLLALVYAGGARVPRPPLACPLAGVGMHYLLLATFAWVAVGNYTVYKRFSKAAHPPPPPPPLDEGGDGPPPSKPLLGFYLLGWGVAMFIVGITSAISLEYYVTDDQLCFLVPGPRPYTLYLPCAVLVVVSSVFLLRLCLLMRVLRRPLSPDRDAGPPAAPSGRDDVAGGPRPSPSANGSAVSDARPRAASRDGGRSPCATERDVSVVGGARPCSPVHDACGLDPVYGARAQACAAAGLVALCALTCVCAACAQAWPFASRPGGRAPEAAGWAYALAAVALGLTIVTVHCFGRSDVRAGWRRTFSRRKADAAADSDGAHVSLISSGCHRREGATGRAASLGGTEASSAAPGDAGYPSFYNARQNGVARKYWQRSRQQCRLVARLNNDVTSDRSGASSAARATGCDRERLTEFMRRNGSMPRLRDFDGQSHVSSRPSYDPAPPPPPPEGPAHPSPAPPHPPLNAQPSFLSQLQRRVPTGGARRWEAGESGRGAASGGESGGAGRHLLRPEPPASSDSDADVWVLQPEKQETCV